MFSVVLNSLPISHSQVVSSLVSPSAFRVLTFTYRTMNNVLGGMSFVTLAKLMGVQKTEAEKQLEE